MNISGKLTILIPCHNEEKGIGRVIDSIPRKFFKHIGLRTDIVVINNNSTDKTEQVAQEKGAIVINETKKGKGNAILTGFRSINEDTTFVVMLDGDNTYKSYEILRMIEPLMSNFCDVVVGSRLGGKMRKNSLKLQNRIANWGYTFLVRQFYRANVTDVLSGFFAWKREALIKLAPHLESDGFEIEMEMITKMKKLKLEMYSVPITYDEREGQSKIAAVTDGIRILTTFFKNIHWSPSKKAAKEFYFKPITEIN